MVIDTSSVVIKLVVENNALINELFFFPDSTKLESNNSIITNTLLMYFIIMCQ